jgi:hypothetical protein
VTIKNKRVEKEIVTPAKISFLVLTLKLEGIYAESKRPMLPNVLERIHNVVALLAVSFDMKKSDMPLKLKV